MSIKDQYLNQSRYITGQSSKKSMSNIILVGVCVVIKIIIYFSFIIKVPNGNGYQQATISFIRKSYPISNNNNNRFYHNQLSGGAIKDKNWIDK